MLRSLLNSLTSAPSSLNEVQVTATSTFQALSCTRPAYPAGKPQAAQETCWAALDGDAKPKCRWIPPPNNNKTLPRMSPGQLGQSNRHSMGTGESGVSEAKRMVPPIQTGWPEPKAQATSTITDCCQHTPALSQLHDDLSRRAEGLRWRAQVYTAQPGARRS